MTEKLAKKVSVETAVLTAAAVKRHGYDRVFRTGQVVKIERKKGEPVDAQVIFDWNSHQVVVKGDNGDRLDVPLSDIKFVHVKPALARHLETS